jgi:Rrf2 family protein
LTKKADYGLIALRHLATTAGKTRSSASAKDIADAYAIPLPLLSKILQKLARGGLLISEQGTHGGYRLARGAKEITTLDVIRAIDGPIILTKCFTDHPGCDQTALCPVREPLRKVHEGILGLLGNISMADLANDEMPVPKINTVSGIRPALANIQTGIQLTNPSAMMTTESPR